MVHPKQISVVFKSEKPKRQNKTKQNQNKTDKQTKEEKTKTKMYMLRSTHQQFSGVFSIIYIDIPQTLVNAIYRGVLYNLEF